jgi:hypothetical protein
MEDPSARSAALTRMQALQGNLNAKHVTEVVLAAIATHPCGVEGNCSDVATGLLQELIRCANRAHADRPPNDLAPHAISPRWIECAPWACVLFFLLLPNVCSYGS